MNHLAQTSQKLGNPVSGIGPLGVPGNPAVTLAKILSTVVGLLTVVAAIYFMFILITGAIGIMTAGGDKGGVEEARRKITNGLIGLIITIAAMYIMDVVAKFLGIPSILDIGAMLTLITQ